MKNIRLRQRTDRPEKDDPKGHRVHREIAIVSGESQKKGTPILKATKRSRSSCLAVKVMPRALVSKPPPMVTIDNRNQSLVISVVTINTMFRRVFINQGISADIHFGDALTHLGSLRKNPPDTKKMKVRELVVSHNSAYNKILGRPTMYKVKAIMTTSIHTRKFITDDDEVEVLREAKLEAKKCHIATKHDSKD
ncbi:hypothetical protein PIB30_061513 [Stylosanthes scabra]|uniref:Uncharacterized protein n=1 Tax=Stylosanthes scabra TaxID=79078 RepID=A0ABU6UJN0_9FABA|nr:hypothetical protein [Stylosanthes scabra]